MRTTIPFAYRCIILIVILMALTTWVASELVSLQIVEVQETGAGSERDNIRSTNLPAQRGIIMDRNREVLTQNIMVSEVQVNRHAMREIDQVTYGLAYNLLVHSPEWKTIKDEEKREKMFRAKRAELLENALVKYTPEERAEIHRQSLTDGSAAKKLLAYDPEICEQYYRAHDKLVAQLLAEFASKAQTKNANTPPLTEEEILNKIGQYEKEALKKEAEARGEKSTVSFTQLIYLIKDLSREDAELLQEMLDANHIHGVIVENGLNRTYTVPNMLAHVLGSVRKDTGAGESGIERFYNDLLQGRNGHREYRTDVRGRIVPHEDDRYMAPQHGLNMQLTIDMRIQAICEAELDKALKANNTDTGCVVVQEAISGDIIAMVNRPSFNLNTREVITPNGIYPYNKFINRYNQKINGDFNYACQANNEPGSTFKSVAVLSAIDMNKVNWKSEVSGTPFTILSKRISDGKRNFSGGMYVSDALMMSCNPATARILLSSCTKDDYLGYLDKLGITKPLPVSLPSVSKGFRFRDKSKITQLDLACMSYGYAISASPMHVAQVYCTLASGGVRVKPRLVKNMITPEGDVYDDCQAKEGENERVLKRETARQMLLSLETVTQPNGRRGRGTGMNAAIPGFRVGGKTGTTEKTHPVTKQYMKNCHIASFAGIFPLDETINWEQEMKKPESERKKVYVIFTVVDGVQGGGGGVAAPVFKAIAENIIELEKIPPHDSDKYNEYKQKKAAALAEAAKNN